MIGRIYDSKKCGKYMVIESFPKKRYNVIFIETGSVVNVHEVAVYTGEIKDRNYPTVVGKGCLGYGPYKPSIRLEKVTQQAPPYKLWIHMINRAYNPKIHEKAPHYKGVTVCDYWLNFQNFCHSIRFLKGYDRWVDAQFGLSDEEMALDKDGVVEGNRVYSPETCQFITKGENSSLVGKAKRAKKWADLNMGEIKVEIHSPEKEVPLYAVMAVPTPPAYMVTH